MKRIALVVFALLACGTCPDFDEIVTILPPANGDAAAPPARLPSHTGDLDVGECRGWCDAGNVVSCSFEEPGGVPTLHCVLPSMCE
jgi:hypothetical protein